MRSAGIYIQSGKPLRMFGPWLLAELGLALKEEGREGWRRSDNYGGEYLFQQAQGMWLEIIPNTPDLSEDEYQDYDTAVFISGDDPEAVEELSDALTSALSSSDVVHIKS